MIIAWIFNEKLAGNVFVAIARSLSVGHLLSRLAHLIVKSDFMRVHCIAENEMKIVVIHVCVRECLAQNC